MPQSSMNNYLKAMAGRAAIESRMLGVLLRSTSTHQGADTELDRLTQLLRDYNELMAPVLGPGATQFAASNDEEQQSK